MPKIFTAEKIDEIRNKIYDYQKDNKEIFVYTDSIIKGFINLYNKTTDDPTGYEVADSYKSFYLSTLKKGMINATKQSGINGEKYVFALDSFNNYEKFMRDLFDTYVKPEIENQDFNLSAYGFGGMNKYKLNSIINDVKEVNQYQCYRLKRINDQTKKNYSIVDEIDDFRKVYDLYNDDVVSHDEQAFEMALMYRDLKTQYNQMSGWAKWFTPTGWSRWWTMRDAKNYIQDRRTDQDKAKTTFDEFITNETNSKIADLDSIDIALDSIKNEIDVAINKWSTQPTYDILNDKNTNIYQTFDLYGTLSEESVVLNDTINRNDNEIITTNNVLENNNDESVIEINTDSNQDNTRTRIENIETENKDELPKDEFISEDEHEDMNELLYQEIYG